MIPKEKKKRTGKMTVDWNESTDARDLSGRTKQGRMVGKSAGNRLSFKRNYPM